MGWDAVGYHHVTRKWKMTVLFAAIFPISSASFSYLLSSLPLSRSCSTGHSPHTSLRCLRLTTPRRDGPWGPWRRRWRGRWRSSSLLTRWKTLSWAAASLSPRRTECSTHGHTHRLRPGASQPDCGGAALEFVLTMRCHKTGEIGEWKIYFQLVDILLNYF